MSVSCKPRWSGLESLYFIYTRLPICCDSNLLSLRKARFLCQTLSGLYQHPTYSPDPPLQRLVILLLRLISASQPTPLSVLLTDCRHESVSVCAFDCFPPSKGTVTQSINQSPPNLINRRQIDCLLSAPSLCAVTGTAAFFTHYHSNTIRVFFTRLLRLRISSGLLRQSEQIHHVILISC